MLNYKNPIRQTKKTEELIVVDDLAPVREIVQFMLRNNRYTNIRSLETAKLALSVLGSRRIALVITDWNMPNMTGIEFLIQIKSDPKLFHIPVIMISDERSNDKVLYAVEEGVDGFLVKPFSEHDLMKSVELALARRDPKNEIERKIFEMKGMKLAGNYREALELGFEILKVRNHPRVILMTCECLYHVEEYDKAIAMMADTEGDNRSSQHANLQGKIYMKLGQHAQGLRALEQSVKLNPLSHGRKIDLAGAYFTTGKIKEAERVITTIADRDLTDLSLVNIADLYLEQGDLEKAGAYLKRTVNPIPETVPVFNNYAVALRRVNRFEEAAEIYRKCLSINPDSDVLHYNLGLLYTKIDKCQEAREALSNALRLNPENQYAKALLQNIPADRKTP